MFHNSCRLNINSNLKTNEVVKLLHESKNDGILEIKLTPTIVIEKKTCN
jgi:hypothetical protein